MVEALKDAACVECFLEMQRQLGARAERYRTRYDVTPSIRGAVHGGPVVTTWVGEAKKELAFHGDTLNATFRIESMCRELGADFLVSELVCDRLGLASGASPEAWSS